MQYCEYRRGMNPLFAFRRLVTRRSPYYLTLVVGVLLAVPVSSLSAQTIGGDVGGGVACTGTFAQNADGWAYVRSGTGYRTARVWKRGSTAKVSFPACTRVYASGGWFDPPGWKYTPDGWSLSSGTPPCALGCRFVARLDASGTWRWYAMKSADLALTKA